MLQARPTSCLSWNYRLLQDGRTIGLIDQSTWRERATCTIGGVRFELYREGTVGDFILEFEGAVLARAQKPRFLTRQFVVAFEGRTYELKAVSAWTREFVLRVEDVVVGRIEAESLFNRHARLRLPESLPLPVQVFVFWLVVLMWRRYASNG